MNQRAVRFGPANGLVGIVHEPNNPSRSRGVGVVMLSAKGLHRVGPGRLHTMLGTRLASHGFTVLRYDPAGVGDSDVHPGRLAGRDVAEMREAMNVLEQTYGIHRFILMGLRSGADNAFRTATVDPRVVGVSMLDGYSYPAIDSQNRFKRREHVVAGLAKLRSAARWGNPSLLGDAVGMGEQAGPGSSPSREDIERDLLDLLERDVRLLCVYTPESGTYRYPDQFFDFFPAVGSHHNVRVEFFEDADHDFTLSRHQSALSDLVSAWAMESPA